MTDPFASPKGDPGTQFTAAFQGKCDNCGDDMEDGDTVHAVGGEYLCERCWEESCGIDVW